MANKGTVASFGASRLWRVEAPFDRGAYGALSITGTARKNEINASTTIRVFDVRLRELLAVQSSASGAFGVYNLAAGRYFLMVDGNQQYLPGIYAVDVS